MKLKALASLKESTLVVDIDVAAMPFTDTLLVLRFIHPTMAEQDFELILSKTGDKQFSGNITNEIKGTWHVHLSPVVVNGTEPDKATNWRLTGQWSSDKTNQFELMAK